MEAVEGSHYIGVFHLTSFVSEREEGTLRKAYNLGGIVEILLLSAYATK